MDRKSLLKFIKKLISKNKNAEAIELLFSLAEEEENVDLFNSVTLISNLYEEIKRKELLDLPFDYRMKNQIVKSLIQLTSSVEKGDLILFDEGDNFITYGDIYVRFRAIQRGRQIEKIGFFVSVSTLILIIAIIFGVEAIIVTFILLFAIEFEGDIEP